MEFCKIQLSVPLGYQLCPYPKSWVREYERIRFSTEPGTIKANVSITTVLSRLSTHGALIDWTTAYSGTKGSVEFLVGLQDDYFYLSPTGNQDNFTIDVKGSDVRLYAKTIFKQSSSR